VLAWRHHDAIGLRVGWGAHCRNVQARSRRQHRIPGRRGALAAAFSLANAASKGDLHVPIILLSVFWFQMWVKSNFDRGCVAVPGHAFLLAIHIWLSQLQRFVVAIGSSMRRGCMHCGDCSGSRDPDPVLKAADAPYSMASLPGGHGCIGRPSRRGPALCPAGIPPGPVYSWRHYVA
jgi:hypothetical protein